MLTISKPLSAGQAQSYHQKEFTAKEQNYWSQRGVIAGEWQGRLADQFGLAGAVFAEDFAKLSQGQHPQTGEQLARQRASYEYQDANGKTINTMEHRAGWDATFSAPKSVSLALVGGDERVREAHRDAAMLDNGGWKAKNLVVSSRTLSLDELSSCCRFLNALQSAPLNTKIGTAVIRT